jgi:hypothetical protein
MFKKKINWIDELEVWVLMQLGWVGKKNEKNETCESLDCATN